MRVAGLKKNTLLDYPGRVAATVFTAGCNLRCLFCQNSSLVEAPFPEMDEDEVLDFLENRRDKLGGVCITGGEPTVQAGLDDFIRRIRDMGYPVKLDTNGMRPDVIKRLAGEGLIDYMAMDIKTDRRRYGRLCGRSADMDAISESAAMLIDGIAPEYEFRTTVVAEYFDDLAAHDIARWLAGAKRYYLQQFVDSDTVMAGAGALHKRSKTEMERYADILRETIKEVSLRGVE